jgi:hypothetical protein
MRRVEDFVLSHRQEIERGVWRSDTLAEEASRKLGFPITPSNVLSGARTFKIRWGDRRTPAIRVSASAFKLVVRELCAISGELGRHIPEELRAIAALEEQEQELEPEADEEE